MEVGELLSSRKQSPRGEAEEEDLRRGPWTVEEDLLLINYIAKHGEGRWNSLARCAGLKRTGKSCRLRWLNYLRPDVRRGNITAEEQLLILELHSRWGNRWSKIAQYLPGRTDNEIKNYWRTRVQKHAKQLQCDVNSKKFKDAMRYLWMPRLAERIQAAAADSGARSADVSKSSPRPAAAATADHGSSESSDVDVPALSSNDSALTTANTAVSAAAAPPSCWPAEMDGCAPGEHAASSSCDDAFDVHGAQGEVIGWAKSVQAAPEIFEEQCMMDLLQQHSEWGGEFGGTTTLWSWEDIWSVQ